MPGKKKRENDKGHEEIGTARIAGAIASVGGSKWGSSSLITK